jgi:hypothetical protein
LGIYRSATNNEIYLLEWYTEVKMGHEAEGIIAAVKGTRHYRRKFAVRTLFTVHVMYCVLQ